mmetsp:Transcript_24005/g.39442  ORF Transcript_24005/g.39442 Transcript_24005/m.39442 type:complete len:216 (-) Transcript_24005:431-1078(-)
MGTGPAPAAAAAADELPTDPDPAPEERWAGDWKTDADLTAFWKASPLISIIGATCTAGDAFAFALDLLSPDALSFPPPSAPALRPDRGSLALGDGAGEESLALDSRCSLRCEVPSSPSSSSSCSCLPFALPLLLLPLSSFPLPLAFCLSLLFFEDADADSAGALCLRLESAGDRFEAEGGAAMARGRLSCVSNLRHSCTTLSMGRMRSLKARKRS